MFQHSVDLHTTPEKALDRARVLFAYVGLEVTQDERDEIAFTGPVKKRNQAIQSPMNLISTGKLSVGAGQIEIQADLGGLRRHLMIVNVVMVVLIVVISAVLFFTGELKREPDQIWGPVVVTGLWLLYVIPVGIWMNYTCKADIRRAMETIAAE